MSDRDNGTAGFVKRMAWGTIGAAGVLGALAAAPGLVDQAVPHVAMNVAVVQPMQPPVPPGPPVPPPMHEPGQQGPETGIHDQPPPPAPAEPDDDAICQVW